MSPISYRGNNFIAKFYLVYTWVHSKELGHCKYTDNTLPLTGFHANEITMDGDIDEYKTSDFLSGSLDESMENQKMDFWIK